MEQMQRQSIALLLDADSLEPNNVAKTDERGIRAWWATLPRKK